MPINMSEEEIGAIYDQGKAAVVSLISTLIDKINSLEEEVNRLKGIINKNSHNSSKLPSTDIGRIPKSLRHKGKHKNGGQKGHPGHTLQRVEKPDHTFIYALKGFCECGRDLDNGTFLNPPKLEFTEHCAEIRKCQCGRIHAAAFPQGIESPVQYGQRVRAYMVYFNVFQLLPQSRCIEIMQNLFGIHLNEGTLNNTLQIAYRNLEKTENAIKESLHQSPVLNLDETGMYVNGKRIWEHSASNASFTYYFCHEKRGGDAIKAGGLLLRYFGRIVHDFWRSYFDFDCLHALCNAHHLLELVFIKEQYKQNWAADMILLLCRIKKTVDAAKIKNRDGLTPGTLRKYEESFARLIACGYKENPVKKPKYTKTVKRGRKAQHPARNLLDRFDNHKK